MSAITLVARHIPDVDGKTEPGLCCVTGIECDTFPKSTGIKPSFTQLDLLLAPDSERIGVDAFKCLNYRPLRSCWHVDESGLAEANKALARSVIFSESRQSPWAMYMTTSYKKHGVLRAPVNTGNQCRILFENVIADFSNRSEVKAWWDTLRAVQDAGLPRSVIESVDIDVYLINKLGWRMCEDFRAWATPKKASPLYQFLAYLLPSKEELSQGKEVK
jgi:hypothetical protein